MAKILIIDDEVHIIELARLYLQRDGFSGGIGHQGQDGLVLVSTNQSRPDHSGYHAAGYRRL